MQLPRPWAIGLPQIKPSLRDRLQIRKEESPSYTGSQMKIVPSGGGIGNMILPQGDFAQLSLFPQEEFNLHRIAESESQFCRRTRIEYP